MIYIHHLRWWKIADSHYGSQINAENFPEKKEQLLNVVQEFQNWEVIFPIVAHSLNEST